MNTMHPRDQDEAPDRDDGNQGSGQDPRRTRVQSDEEMEEQSAAADPNIINKDR